MKKMTRIMVIGVGLALAACTSADRFDGPGAGNTVAQNPAFDQTAGIVPGSVNDPTSVAFFQQSVGDRVLFDVNQHVLSASGQATLAAQAQWLAANPDYTAIIEGHADEQGTRQYNIALGERRAQSAKAYLVSQGVPAARLKTVSYGKERPIEVCSDEACYSKNRRAVTVLATGLTG